MKGSKYFLNAMYVDTEHINNMLIDNVAEHYQLVVTTAL